VPLAGSILVVVVAPTLFWGAYFYYKDRYKPEPLTKLGLSYLLGLGAAYLAMRLYDLAEVLGAPTDVWEMLTVGRGRFLAYSLGVIGPLEELAKLVPFIVVCARFRAFDEKMDGIVYAAMVSLGFASLENFLYIGVLHGAELYARAVAAPIVHCLFASVWGYAYAWALMSKRSRLLFTTLGFVASALAHGLYDFLATDALWTSLSAGVVLVVWTLAIVVMERLGKRAAEESGTVTPQA
jgi:RsiW-degrading membrane proteinase PrsW (M82 family)